MNRRTRALFALVVLLLLSLLLYFLSTGDRAHTERQVGSVQQSGELTESRQLASLGVELPAALPPAPATQTTPGPTAPQVAPDEANKSPAEATPPGGPRGVPVRHGAQVLFAATIDEIQFEIDGQPRALPFPDNTPLRLVAERFVFVEDVPTLDASGGLAWLRTYLSAGIDSNEPFDEPGHGATPPASSEVLGLRPTISAFRSELEHASVRRSADGATGLRWELGSPGLVVAGAVWPGLEWKIPAHEFAAVLSPGGDLAWRAREDGQLASAWLCPGGPMSMDEGDPVGEVVVTAQALQWIEGWNRERAELVLRLSGEWKLEDVTRWMATPAPLPLGSSLSVKASFELEGRGAASWIPGQPVPPRLEIHGAIDLSVEAYMTAAEHFAEGRFRLHGNLAYLGGHSRRDESLWKELWAPRERFLSPDSFVLCR